MSNVPNRVNFQRKSDDYRPWNRKFDPVPASEVDSLVAERVELRAQGPDQSTPLPIRNPQDLMEFRAFRGESSTAEVEETVLANELVRLQEGGAEFFATVDEQREEIGAYGAYNALTGDESLEGLQVQLSSGAGEDGDFLGLYRTVLQNPQLRKPEQLSGLAESLSSGAEDLATGVKIQEIAVRGLAQEDRRAAFSLRVARAKDSDGAPKYRHLESQAVLYLNALKPELSDGEFLRTVRNSVHPEDKAQVSADLLDEFYPQASQRLKGWFGESPSDLAHFQESFLRYTSIHNPDFKPPVALMHISEENDSPHWDMLLRVTLENPAVLSLGNAVKIAAQRFDESEEQQEKLSTMYRSVLGKVAETHRHANLSLDLEAKSDFLQSPKSVNSLHAAALKPHLDLADFMVEAVAGAHPEDQARLTLALGEKLFEDPRLEVPESIKAEMGNYTAPELRAVYETLMASTTSKTPAVEIGVDEENLIVGDEILEVDL